MQSNKTFSNPALALILTFIIGIIIVIFLWQNESQKQAAEIETLKSQLTNVGQSSSSSNKRMNEIDEQNSVKKISFENAKKAHKLYKERWDSLQITGFDFHEGFSLDIKTMVEFQNADTLYLSLGMRPYCKKDIHGNCINEESSGDLQFEKKLLSLYIYGIDSLGNYIKDSTTQAPLVYEYLKPCPNQCPDRKGLYQLIND